MALRIKGTEVRDKGRVLESLGSHKEALGSARDRASSGGSSALPATAGREILFDFGDAQPYLAIVDTEAAQLADIAAESDPDRVRELLGRTVEEIAAAHRDEVKAKPIAYPFRDKGQTYPAGSYVVLRADGSSLSMTAGEFTAHYAPVAAKQRPAKDKE